MRLRYGVWGVALFALAVAACGAADDTDATPDNAAPTLPVAVEQPAATVGPTITLRCPDSFDPAASFTCDVVFESAPGMAGHVAYSIGVLHVVDSIASVPETWEDTGIAYPEGIIEVAQEYNDAPRFDAGAGYVVTQFVQAAFPTQNVLNVGVITQVDFECRSGGTHELRFVTLGQDVVQGTFTVDANNVNQVNQLRGTNVSCDEGTSEPGDLVEPAEPGQPAGDGPANGAPVAPGNGDNDTGMIVPGQQDADAAARAGAGLGDLGEGGGSSTLDRSGIAVLVAALAAIGVAFAVAAPLLRRRLRARGPGGE